MIKYHRAGVALYILVDFARQRRHERLHLIGFRWTAAGYEPLESDADGRLWLGPVRLWPGVVDNEIVCQDEAGDEIGDFAGQVGRTEAEAQARSAEERLRQLEAEVRRLRGGE